MPEISTAGIFQVAFIARRMEQTLQAFFQTTFETIGRVCATRHARGGLGLILGRLKNKKQPAQPVFLAKPLIPTVTPSSLPRERVRERVTSRKACIGAVRVLRKVAEIRGVPSPQPSPTGGGGRLQQIQTLQVV